jgi:hypothetical protein
MRKIVAIFVTLVASIACVNTYAYTPGIKTAKQQFNEAVVQRLGAELNAAATYNRVHKKKNYFIRDNESIRFFKAIFTSDKAKKLFSDNYDALGEDAYDGAFNDYIDALRTKYLPGKYKDYQIYFMVAGMFYTHDITQTDVTRELDWKNIRPLSYDHLPATAATAPYASNTAAGKAVQQEFSEKVNVGIFNNLVKTHNLDISVTEKTIVIYKWLLFDLDINNATLESFLRNPSLDLTSLPGTDAPKPVMFMSHGFLHSTISSAKGDIDGLETFLKSDGDYSDIISLGNMPYQRNKLMKDVTNAFVYFYQKDNKLIPDDFCSRTDTAKERILDVLAASYQASPTGNWDNAPFRNPVLFTNIDWDTRKCIFDYLLNKSLCTDAKGVTSANACEEMLIDAIGAAKGDDQKKVLAYFNDPANYKKVYEKIDDAGGVDNYTGIVFAFCKMAAMNGYWDTKVPNPISNALFDFHNIEKTIGSVSFNKTEFDQEIRTDSGLHFEILRSENHYVDDNIGYEKSPLPAEVFNCSPFTPIQFVYSDKLEFSVQKADGTTPVPGDVVTVPALYLQWLIRTDFKMTTIKTGQTVLLSAGLLGGVSSFVSATSIAARIWAVGDVFFTTAALVSSNTNFQNYVKKKWPDHGLEVLSTINTLGMWYGGAYMGRGAIVYLSEKLEQRAVQTVLQQMLDDTQLATQFPDEFAKVEKVADEMEKAGVELTTNKLVTGSLASSLTGTVKETYEQLLKAGLTAEEKAGSILMKNAGGETVAIIYNNKITVVKWGGAYKLSGKGYSATATPEGYIILKNGDDIRLDLGWNNRKQMTADEVNNYLRQGQGKDADGQPYLENTKIDELELGNNGEVVYFVENELNLNTGIREPNPGFYASKEPISTVYELRQKLAVKAAWKKDINNPTLRKYRVIKPLKVRSGIIGPQIEADGTLLAGGGHQYELCQSMGNWKDYLELISEAPLSKLASTLQNSIKQTFLDLLAAGLRAEDEVGAILLKNAKGETVASIANNKLTPVKWSAAYKASGTKIQTSEGYILIKDGDNISFDLGFKQGGGRTLEAEEANEYLIKGQGKDADGQPYLVNTKVQEMVLGNNGETVYFVENFNNGIPSPGQYASKDAIKTIEELRQTLAVKEAWKPAANEPTLRAYKVIAPINVRSGIIGPQFENGVKLVGGGHQYEVVTFLGNDWRKYLEPIGDPKGIKLTP